MKQTNDKVFFDTNVLIYLYSEDEIDKRTIVENLCLLPHQIIISTQIINELIWVMHKKRKIPYGDLTTTIDELREKLYVADIGIDTTKKALKLASQNKYAYFDSLIIAAALENDCSKLYTQDMHNNHIIDKQLHLLNPFTKNS